MSACLKSSVFRVMSVSVVLAAVAGCATVYPERTMLRSVDQSAEYPVTVIGAAFTPSIEVDIKIEGKADGARMGAGVAMLECSPALAAGPLAPLVFVPCAVLAGVVVGTVGAIYAAPKADIETFQRASQREQGDAAQRLLADHARTYLNEVAAISPMGAAPGWVGPQSDAERPQYPLVAERGGSLLELSMQSIRYVGSGLEGDYVCLYMTARGRKIDAVTGRVIEEMSPGIAADCLTPVQWMEAGGERFRSALLEGYRVLAQLLVDNLYLVYRPAPRERHDGSSPGPVPKYALAPVSPRAPEMYLDLRVITRKARHIQGFGGSHFVDVDSLTPAFVWESFPRVFDEPAGGFSGITYDLRIYTSRLVWDGKFAEPATLVLERFGLSEPRFVPEVALQPCTRYFWTVRARFSLKGMQRVTEWAGAYHTAGGEVAPSRLYYFPFRTPEADGSDSCWR